MILTRIESKGLAHFSYFLGSRGEAAVIDPRRDCSVYLDLARREEMRIRHVFETHRHEDFVTGSLDLARRSGAAIHHGAGTPFAFGSAIYDGEEVKVGALTLRALHTPGHTVESMSYALYDESSGGVALAVFTGDALFAGDTGRTDFGAAEEGPRRAGLLYDSLVKKLFPLGDGAAVFPAHGAGSVCGRGIARRTVSTLGLERALNPELRLAREAFIARKVEQRHELPAYFKTMERLNTEGPPPLERLPVPPPLDAEEFRERMHGGALVIDLREPASFSGAHLGGSYHLWLDGLTSFAGHVLPEGAPILLVAEAKGDVKRAVRTLVRLGYDRLEGCLRGGIESWYAAGYACESMPFIAVRDVAHALQEQSLRVLDVRSEAEWESGHLTGATHIPAGQVERRLAEVPPPPLAVMCSSGNRASFAASVLRRGGFTEVRNVQGGMSAWKSAGLPL